MPRYARNAVILAKVETTAGTDAAPTGAADAVLVTDLTITPLDAQNVDRDFIRPYFGGSEQLVGVASVKASFTVELAGSGTAATAPKWGVLLQGCAMAEASLTSPARVEYSLLSAALKTLTIYYYDDGVLHKLLGAMGNVKISAKVGDRPKLMFDFIGLDGGVTAAALPSATYTAWKTPPMMTKASVVDVTVGCTYTAGAISGGTVYATTGLELDMGNQTEFVTLLSSERVDITDRDSTGAVEMDLAANGEVNFMTSVKANTTQSMALTIGTAAGNKIILFAPKVQLINPKKVDRNRARLVGFDLRLVPNAGNDELLIVTQ